jgi:hypothetical protein
VGILDAPPGLRPYRDSVFGGRPIVCSRPNGFTLNTGNLSNGTDTSGNYRYMHKVLVDCSDIRLVYANYYNGVSFTANAITVKAAIEYPAVAAVGNGGQTGAKLRAWFKGVRSFTLDPAAWIVSDPIAIDLTAGQIIYTRTYVSVASAGMVWPVDLYTKSGNWEGATRGAPATDLVDSSGSTIAQSTEAGFGPVAIIGTPKSGRPGVIGIVGDSISYGSGDTDPNGMGFAQRAVLAANLPYMNVAKPGEKATDIATTPTEFLKLRMVSTMACTKVIEGYSRNDWANSRTLAQIQADKLTIWGWFYARNIPVYAWTSIPGTTSTDSWATVGNQTTVAGESVRLTLNAWIRDGAPIDATTRAAVVVGTSSNVLRIGAATHPVAAYWELADTVESARDSGKWKASYTADGTHPNATGHAAMAAGVVTANLA